jgi:cytochrome c oxidase subunit III
VAGNSQPTTNSFRRPEPAETGAWIAIGAIAMCFAALSSALLVRQGAGTEWLRFQIPHILYAATLALITSSVTLIASQSVAVRRASSRVRPWLYITASLGLLFLGGLLLAWRQLAAQGILLATSGSSSFFYVLTALYAIFVAGAILAALILAGRAATSASRTTPALSIYWHFLTAAWICIFLLLSFRI